MSNKLFISALSSIKLLSIKKYNARGEYVLSSASIISFKDKIVSEFSEFLN